MMQKLKDVTDLERLRKLLQKDYRDGYLDLKVRAGIAYQMRAIRKELGFSQIEMAKKLGMKQSVVSRLEDIDRGNINVSTLLNIAKQLDVAVVVKFVDYAEFLKTTRDMSESALRTKNIFQTVSTIERSSNVTPKIANYTINIAAFHQINNKEAAITKKSVPSLAEPGAMPKRNIITEKQMAKV